MRKIGFVYSASVRFLRWSVFSALLVILRYVLKTPQPLESVLPGESRLFKWTYGHVFYKVLGLHNARPLVLLHTPEIGGSSYEWRKIIEQLAQHYRVYALDLLGFGLSDHPSIYYSSETYTTLYQDFLTKVVQQPALLVASGLSCNYTIAVAYAHPELCVQLILLSPRDENENRQSARIRLLQQPFVRLFVYALLTPRVVLRYVMAQQQLVNGTDIADDELDATYASAHQLGAHYAAVAFLAGQLQLDVSKYIEILKTPVLLLWGEKAIVPHGSLVRTAREHIQEVHIQGVGLRPHKERPAEVVAQLIQWSGRQEEAMHATSAPVLEETAVIQEKEQSTSDALNDASESRNAEVEMASYTKEGEDITMNENNTADATEQVEAYCVKCKQKRIMQHPTTIVTKNGRNAKEGTCPVCGTKLFRFVAN